MTKAIFTVNPESPYDDVEGERYHFEARGHMAHYLAVARAAIGDWVIFHEPQRAGGRKAYIGVARIAGVERDGRSADGWIVRLTGYLRFDAPVSMRDASGPYRETMLKAVDPIAAGKTLRGHSLRPVSDLEFAAIVHLGWPRRCTLPIPSACGSIRLRFRRLTNLRVNARRGGALDFRTEKSETRLSCQSALERDPLSAPKRDPSDVLFFGCRIAAEPKAEQRSDSRWRFSRDDQARFLKRQLSLPVSTMSQ